MNIIFKKVYLENFMSFEKAELELDKQGTIFVKGINNFEDTATSNGSGKSALTSESIIWCLTGKASKKSINNLKIKDSVAKVRLDFSIDKNEYTVERINDKNKTLSIIKNGKDISGNTYTKSKEILSHELGFINESVIASIIILGQGMEHRFSKLTASERKSMLEYLVGMDTLLENISDKLERADERISNSISETNLKITEQNTIKNTSQQIIDNYQNRTVLSEKDYNDNLNKFNEITEKGKKLKEEIQNNKDKINSLLQEKDGINTKLLSINNQINTLRQNINQQLSNKNNLNNKLDNIKSQLESAEKKECPLCHQHLEDKTIEEHLKEELKNIEKEINNIKDTNSDEKEVEKLQIEYNNLQSQTNDKQININEVNSTITTQNLEIQELTKEYNKYKELLAEYEKNKAENDSLEQVIKDSKLKIKEAETKLESLLNEASKYNLDKDISKFFKNNVSRKFRNFLLEGVFKYLNERLEYYSSTLFTEYVIKLENNNSNIEIRVGEKYFEDLSGGEKRRADIAVQCALRDLARNQRGLSINLMVLDEIFDYLDPLGIETMVKFIDSEITDVNTMFITTHMENLKLNYDSELEVIKGKDEISTVKIM